MKKHSLGFKVIIAYLFAFSSAANAASISWEAQGANDNINNPINWNPNTVPGSNDQAVFDSLIFGINTSPTESSAPFSVSSFHFLNSASAFNFNFNNQTLTFHGAGITGFQTTPAINVTNLDNSFFPGNLLSFLGSTSTSGSANITVANIAALTGSQFNISIGNIESNLYASGPFTIASGGKITASNIGNDSAVGSGNNSVATTALSQLRFDQSFTAENNALISVLNQSTYSGANTVLHENIGVVNGSQFVSSGSFQAGDNFNCIVQNIGNDSSFGLGNNSIGIINNAQMLLQTSGAVGDNCTITVANTGSNSSQTTGFSDFIGYLTDEQLFVGNVFQAGNDFLLRVSNIGKDTSSGHGNALVAAINSNSGTSGNQILLQQGCELGDRATISIANSGTYNGTNTGGGSSVGLMNLGQIAIGDITAPGSYAFSAGDYFNVDISNIGINSGQGIGGDVVGNVSTDQMVLYTPCTLGNNATITLTNSGKFSGNSSASYVNVGSAGSSQLNFQSTFQAGDNFTLNASNSGTHTGTGTGNDFIGDIITGQQVSFNNGLLVGDNASFNISNSGSNSSSTINNNQVGSLMGYGKQMFVKDQFQAGDNLVVAISNSGFDDSTAQGGNYTGFINNNTVDHSASQLHLDAGGTVGNRASFFLSNTGVYQSSSTSGTNIVGVLAGQQFYSVNDFHAEDNFGLLATNSGTGIMSGKNSQAIGQVGSGGQVEFSGGCSLGDSASFVIRNTGTNHDALGTSNVIGFVNGSQLKVGGNFTAGSNLNMTANNQRLNAGDASNLVGYVNGSQFYFAQGCSLNSGSSITAFNSGNVSSSQIVFGQGFNIASGKVSIQALNSGTVGSYGIDIQGSNAGGNAEILLSNSSMNIETTLPSFTIGGLNGDSTSFVQPLPMLIIDTDAATHTEFSGVIQNFPAAVSTLMKSGPGSQKLSGANTYTGLTTIQEGSLILNGSLQGDVLINPLGILKGNGTIGGTVTNIGSIAPGESIGTLSILSNYNNNGGTYNAEVNSAGLSDLILVSGTATLNGGIVNVSTDNGTFRFNQPYTIVSAESVNGTYSGASSSALISPVLSYDPKNVYLTLLQDLSRAAETRNQRAVAKQIDSIIHPNASQTLIISRIANLPLTDAQQALESLSGYQHTDDAWAAEMANRQFIRRLYDPLCTTITQNPCSACDPCILGKNCGWKAWLETGGRKTKLGGDNEAYGFRSDSYEVTAGLQSTVCNDTILGIASSYEYDSLHYVHEGGSGRFNRGFIGLYGLYRPEGFYLLADATYGYSTNNLDRSIRAGVFHDKARSTPKITQATFYGEIGVDFNFCSLSLQPFAGIQAEKNWRNHVLERNDNGLGLDIKKHQWTSDSARLGVHLTYANICQCFTVSLDAAWNKLLTARKNHAHARFIDFGREFDIIGIPFNANGFDYALILLTDVCEGTKAYVKISGEAWHHASACDALAGIEFLW